jgi:FkbM family methyltransferase
MKENLIFDVGLHKGEDSEFYLKKGFNVVAIEALPHLCSFARTRLKRYIDSGQLTILNVAIADKTGPITFYMNNKESMWGTTSPEWVKRNARFGADSSEIKVDGILFNSILDKFGVPYYLKIDIEGADLLCLKALRDVQSKPKYVSIESTKTSWNDLRAEFSLFEALGYSRFKLVQQADVERQTCPFPAKEGLYIDHRFEADSSGLFGEEAPGNWVSKKEALKMYRRIFLGYKLFGDAGSLVKFKPHLRKLPFSEDLAKAMLFPSLSNPLFPGWFDTHATY